jgi:hypothetical protein
MLAPSCSVTPYSLEAVDDATKISCMMICG